MPWSVVLAKALEGSDTEAVESVRSFGVYGVGSSLLVRTVKIVSGEEGVFGLTKGEMGHVPRVAQEAALTQLGVRELRCCAGGSAENTIVALAQMGVRAAFAGGVGQDEAGRYCVAELTKAGIRATGKARPGDTGTCLILVSADGERTMGTDLGISGKISVDDVSSDVLRASQWLYAEAYLLAHPEGREGLFEILEEAQRCGTRVAVSLSDLFVVRARRDDVNRLVSEFADLVIGNEREATELTGGRDGLDSLAQLCDRTRAACVTLGADGAYLNLDGRTQFVPAFRTSAVDVTGAGDMFAAGLLCGVCRAAPQLQGGLLGAHVAREVVRQIGPRLGRRLSREVLDIRWLWGLGMQDVEWLGPREQRTLAAFLGISAEVDGNNAEMVGFGVCQLFWRPAIGARAFERAIRDFVEAIDNASERRFARRFVELEPVYRQMVVGDVAGA